MGKSERAYEFQIPATWVPIPSPDAPNASSWVEEWIATVAVPAAAIDSFAAELRGVAAFVAAQPPLAKDWFAIVDPVGINGVRAIASTVAFDSRGSSAPDVAESARAASTSGDKIELWSREVQELELDGRAVVTIHDMIVASSGESADLSERFVGMVFGSKERLVVQLEIQTPDLATFDDIVATGIGLLDSLTLGEKAAR